MKIYTEETVGGNMKLYSKIICLTLVLCALLLQGCNQRPGTNGGFDYEIAPPEGTLDGVWFDDFFMVVFPSQIADKNFYFSKTFIYGDPSIKQPAICMFSEEIGDLKIYEILDEGLTNELYVVDKLEPTEALVLGAEFDGTPKLAVSFKDSDGVTYTYGIFKDEAGQAQYIAIE